MDKLKRLQESNEQLAEAIRNGDGTEDELRVLFEAYEENRQIIEELSAS